MAEQPFNLRKRFAIISLGVITVMAVGLGALFALILPPRILQTDSEVSMDYVQSILATDDSAGFLSHPNDPTLKQRFLRSMVHLVPMGKLMRAHAYDPDGRIIWSTDPQSLGLRDTGNQELQRALAGELVSETGRLSGQLPRKPEQTGLPSPKSFYVESYIPVFDADRQQVLGVIELYKIPVELNASLHEALMELWLTCAAFALVLYLALYGVVARADRTLQAHSRVLAESQSLATTVALASAVAHNLRNPLASIRTSAELLVSNRRAAPEQAEHGHDIIHSVDRASRWITELVRIAHTSQTQLNSVALLPLWRECLTELQPQLNQRRIHATLPEQAPPTVWANEAMLRQILLSLVTNAIEAMPLGGELQVDWRTTPPNRLALSIRDTGTGFTDSAQQALFKPFFSTKRSGMGIGLASAKAALEQWGGRISVQSGPTGTCITVELVLSSANADTSSGVLHG